MEPKRESGSPTKWALLVADVWADPELKRRLLTDPATVLKERDITPPQGVTIKVVEDTANLAHLVLPAQPEEESISSNLLDRTRLLGLTSEDRGFSASCRDDVR